MTNRPWKIAGVNFDHMHMGDLLRLARNHPRAEIVGVCHTDVARMEPVLRSLEIPSDRVFTQWDRCLEQTQPDIVILCPRTAEHADYVEAVAPYNVHVLVEKPMAASVSHADRMIAAMESSGKLLAINWPLAWYPPHLTAKRLLDKEMIGDLIEVHYYDGNRGPLRHIADKVEVDAEQAAREVAESWWYKRDAGGGSLLDYLGYGVTLGTWYLNGRKPIEITAAVDEKPGMEVDEHSITIARYEFGLSKFETRWGTFTDPWIHQPQPKCGFVLVGTRGTIASYDYEQTIRIQTLELPEGETVPVDAPEHTSSNPVGHLIHCIETGAPLHGPLNPALCRTAQQIVDSAALSAAEKRTVALLT